jgi:putative FmdB family regulatory protein
MPTYDYRCPNGHDFEHFFRKISDAATELECPTCGALATRRVSGGAGLVFKGSGFYLTDYGKNAHRKGGGGGGSDASGPSAGGESSAGGGDSAKSDATPATAPKSDSAAKSEAAKTTDSKPSGKTKGSDSK